MRLSGLYNSTDKTIFLKFTYIVMITLLLSVVAITPIFIRHHFLLFKKYVIEEDVVEAVFIIILLLIACLTSHLYQNELKKYRQETRRLSRDKCDLSGKLTDAFKYIGGLNVQIQQIRSIFCGPEKYPATENEFKKVLTLLARKLLAIVNADWVMIRIICQGNSRTLKEHLENRKDIKFLKKGISNKAIIANRSIDGYSIVVTRHENSLILGACVFPKKDLDEEERIFAEAITHQIEMLYVIYALYRHHESYPTCNSIAHSIKK